MATLICCLCQREAAQEEKEDGTSPSFVTCSTTSQEQPHAICTACLDAHVQREIVESTAGPSSLIPCPQKGCDCKAMDTHVICRSTMRLLLLLAANNMKKKSNHDEELTSFHDARRVVASFDEDAIGLPLLEDVNTEEWLDPLSPQPNIEHEEPLVGTQERRPVERNGPQRVVEIDTEAASQNQMAPATTHATEEQGGALSPLEHLVHVVEEVLTLGATGQCPRCKNRTWKTGGCSRLVCDNCACLWCYCCGKERLAIHSNCCETCERVDLLSDTASSWQRCPMDEDDEFRVKKTLFFLKRVKDSVSPLLWMWLTMKHGALLNSLETRSWPSPWLAIDEANCPKLYGISTQLDLMWLDDTAETLKDFHDKTMHRFHYPTEDIPDTIVLVKRGTTVESPSDWDTTAFWVAAGAFLFLNSVGDCKWHDVVKNWAHNRFSS